MKNAEHSNANYKVYCFILNMVYFFSSLSSSSSSLTFSPFAPKLYLCAELLLKLWYTGATIWLRASCCTHDLPTKKVYKNATQIGETGKFCGELKIDCGKCCCASFALGESFECMCFFYRFNCVKEAAATTHTHTHTHCNVWMQS